MYFNHNMAGQKNPSAGMNILAQFGFCAAPGTANPTWGDIFESSNLKVRRALLPRFGEKRHSNFKL